MSLNKGDIDFYDEWHQQPLSGESALKSSERHKLLRDELQITGGATLVVGCGGADEMSMIPEGMKAIGVDISSIALKQSRAQFPQHSYVMADAAHLPFCSSCKVETIVCSEVIEHVRDSHQALREFWRVLKEHGQLYLTTPNWMSFYGLARLLARLVLEKDFTSGDQPYDRWTTRNRLSTKLQHAGFTPQRWIGLWFFPPFGKGQFRLPNRILMPILRFLMPIERRLRSILPAWGHVICASSVKEKGK